ncbi:extracellular solute-binding protein [Paenibacillus sp. CC-CFT747]|nr:extracellular solute-binding protein [Paenibacillus sp. CC-CFT747]
MWVRKDWLQKLNLQMPTTLDEFLTVAKAFTEQDPDGNGKKDTYGITGAKLDGFATIFGAYKVGQPGTFYEKDGKVINAYFDPAMPEALKYIKSLFDAGVVDPEIMTNKGNVEVQKAFQGKAGFIFKGWTEIAKDEFVSQYKAINPNADWVQMVPLKGPGGAFDGTFDYDRPSRYWVIPKAIEKDKAKLQKVLELINYVSGKEGNTLVMYGLEGKHYNLKDGQVVPTDLMAKEGNYFNLYQITGRPNKEYLAIKFPNQAAATDFAIKTPRIPSFDSSVIPPTGFNKADADRFAEEEMIKFVTGKRPLAEYADFLKTLETTFKYKLYVDEGTKQIKEQGFVK